MGLPDTQNSKETVRVWDPFIRIFHWCLAVGMLAAWITSSWRSTPHQWMGLALGCLLIARIFWGFFGSTYARFSQFLRGPQTSLAYLYAIVTGAERRYLGHNPAGALMILALIFTIAATVISGWLMTTDTFFGDDTMQFVDKASAYSVVGLLIFHVAGVMLASKQHKENLVVAMFTGKKRAPTPNDIA